MLAAYKTHIGSDAARNLVIVEDEVLTALAMEHAVVDRGHRVAGTARTGEEAIALCAEHRPDMVLMDVTLAGAMDGIEAATRIQADFGIPVVFITAHSDSKTIARMKALAPLGIVSKPLDPTLLDHLIAELGGGKGR